MMIMIIMMSIETIRRSCQRRRSRRENRLHLLPAKFQSLIHLLNCPSQFNHSAACCCRCRCRCCCCSPWAHYAPVLWLVSLHYSSRAGRLIESSKSSICLVATLSDPLGPVLGRLVSSSSKYEQHMRLVSAFMSHVVVVVVVPATASCWSSSGPRSHLEPSLFKVSTRGQRIGRRRRFAPHLPFAAVSVEPQIRDPSGDS